MTIPAFTPIFKPIAPRPAPAVPAGLAHWLHANLWQDPRTRITTLVLVAVLLWVGVPLADWALWRAHWQANADLCHASPAGACWGVIHEKFRIIVFGRYPFEAQWRPLLATALLLALLVASCMRMFWRPVLALLWVLVLAVFTLLMGGAEWRGEWGRAWGLAPVETDLWGGLPLTLLLASVSIVLAFPMALLLALGRRSHLPAIRSLCTVYVELVRGVPLISVLFMASFMFPLFMPEGMKIDKLLRVLAGISLFAAAYMAEVIRGGLQAIPQGQLEGATSLGLSYWQTQRLVVLPQALAMVVPGLMNNFIGIFKDTSLVTIVSLYELTGAMGLALNSDADWRPYKIEAYVFIALIYFVFCSAMSRYSQWVELQVNRGRPR
jgi:general L-amino acid transport system permease protein